MELFRTTDHRLFDLNNTNLVICLSSLSFITFAIVFYLSQRYVKCQNSIQNDLKISFASRMVSTVHAVLTTAFSLWILYFDMDIYLHELLYKSYGVTFTLCFSIGYLIYDALSMLVFNELRDFASILHHVVAMTAFYACSTRGVFTLIAIVRLTSEFSTPFINNRWMLLTLNMKNTKLFLYNGYMIVMAFLLCRIFPIIPIWLQFYSLIGSEDWNQIALKYKFICVFTSLPLDVLNVYWFGKIMKTVLKSVKKPKE